MAEFLVIEKGRYRTAIVKNGFVTSEENEKYIDPEDLSPLGPPIRIVGEKTRGGAPRVPYMENLFKSAQDYASQCGAEYLCISLKIEDDRLSELENKMDMVERSGDVPYAFPKSPIPPRIELLVQPYVLNETVRMIKSSRRPEILSSHSEM